ncbi:uncharacterized protein LOC111902134 isoform X1 [Lactuca sativa]|uniref:OTU domain-containing protein n=2 Tax=Lactuca sativa TaxID=4236 RepID=A0A9R1UFP0_LACSA|nr:uncharacterized protein LOC111902134 isoform X1 [Lactuca sativa]KAJ0186213.1 hypothetical protein LSAT_V11C900480460 [Lactuca sativa]
MTSSHTSAFSSDMVFKTHHDLIEWVQNKGRSLGYIIIIKRTKVKPSGWISKTTLMCDRGGIHKSSKPSTRNTKSKKINCPFQLAGKHSKLYGIWTLQVVCEKHNHEPASTMEGHPYTMRLSDKETHLVVDLIKKNMKPSDILSTLKERSKDNVSSLQTIYNACKKYLGKLKELTISSLAEEPMRNSSYMEQKNHSCSYINQLPNLFHRYIMHIHDVKSDGNCGFRAIAVCLGLNEDAWPTIQSDLMEELNTHRDEYDEIFGRECRLKLHNSLNFFRSDIAASLEHWMSLHDMGIVIASRYNVILHCLSVGDSITYLPLRSTPPLWYQHVAIAVGHVNDNHYVKLDLQGGYPMPSVVPQWVHFKHVCASAWVTPYINRLNMYAQHYNVRYY